MSKLILLDVNVLMFKAIHNYARMVQTKLETNSNLFIMPPNYTCFTMLLSALKKIHVDSNTRIIACQDGHSWRKDFYACLSGDTDILTENGWKNIKDFVKNKSKEKVATLNHKKNIVEYQESINWFEYEYQGDMYKLGGKGHSVDFLMTPNHNHFWKKQHESEFKLETLEQIGYRKEIETYREFPWFKKYPKKYFILPKLTTKNSIIKKGKKYTYIVEHLAKKIPMNTWLRFLGWYLSEGCCGKKIKSRCTGFVRKTTVCISQSKKVHPKYFQEIYELLSNEMGYKVTTSNRENIKTLTISDVQLANYLGQFGKSFDKYIPRDFLNNLTKEQCDLLLMTLIKGDGSIKDIGFSYTTVSKRLANDIQELALKAGYTATCCKPKGHNWYFLTISKNFTPRTKKQIWKNQKMDVYCIEVPNHIFFIRRKGKVGWTGNSYKAQRKEQRDKNKFVDFDEQFKIFNRLWEQLDEATDWNFVRNWSCSEADDIISTCCRLFKDDEIIIVSIDGDLKMLCYYPHVKYFTLMKKCNGSNGIYEKIDEPLKILMKKSKSGDVADNVLVGENEQDEDRELRHQIVNLLELPDFVEQSNIELLSNLPKKELHLDKLPSFKDAKDKFLQIYDPKYKIDCDYCYKLAEKRAGRKKQDKLKKEKPDV